MYLKEDNLGLIAKNDNNIYLIPKMANRHGLIAGATGTGKTVTLKVLAETFSDMGTPVFLADVKGDLTGMVESGNESLLLDKLDSLNISNFECRNYPSIFWDVFGKRGHNVRTTISSMGPELISRLLELTEIQTGVMNIVFKVADDNGWLLIDFKDLKEMVKYVSENSKELRDEYGNVSPQTAGAIQRSLLRLEEAGGDIFFGEPDLDIFDWMKTNDLGQGFVNILECQELVQSPLLYSTFLLWMLSDLYEKLPEAGDLDKPKMIFFFDEAHLLFDDAPKALVGKVEQVVRLIRSKGVGVYFISQKPSDIPDDVLAQLGNRVQHALRAYTPKEQKAIKAAAQSFRINPEFNTQDVISELGIGEALVSFLDENGVPNIVERAFIVPPSSSMSVASDELIKETIESSPYFNKYREVIDRESAYEIISEAKAESQKISSDNIKSDNKTQKKTSKRQSSKKEKSVEEELLNKTMNVATSTIGREIGKSISRGLLGGIKKMF